MTMYAPRRPRQRPLGPNDSRTPRRRKAHGLSVAEQDRLRALQGGACALCGRVGVRLSIDHWHGHCPGSEGCRACIRSLLCTRCQNSLAKVERRDTARLITYLGGTPPEWMR